MDRKTAFAWGAGIMVIALLNIIDVLPDWTTFAAILTVPFVATWRCGPARKKG